MYSVQKSVNIDTRDTEHSDIEIIISTLHYSDSIPGHSEAGVNNVLHKKHVLACQCADVAVADFHVPSAARALIRLHSVVDMC